MMQTFHTLGIDRLSVADRIELVHDIWDSIAAEIEQATVTTAEHEEVERRLAEHQANPEAAIPWEQVEAEALARLRR